MLTGTLTSQEHLNISCCSDSSSLQSQWLSPAYNRTPHTPCTGQLGVRADLHPEVLDLAQLLIPPEVNGLLQAVVPRLQLEHLFIQLLVQLQRQEEAH